MIKFYVIVDRAPEDRRMARNGGDYAFGRTVAVEDGKPVAVRFWTSAEFDFCPVCGRFGYDCCEPGAYGRLEDAGGWESGELITDPRYIEIEHRRLENGEFGLIGRQDDVQRVLELLAPVVGEIDGGCPYCIRAFCEKANVLLKQSGFPLVFISDDDGVSVATA